MFVRPAPGALTRCSTREEPRKAASLRPGDGRWNLSRQRREGLGSQLLRLDLRRPEGLAPTGDISVYQRAEFRGRGRHGVVAGALRALAEAGGLDDLPDLRRQAVHDGLGRPGRCDDTEPE